MRSLFVGKHWIYRKAIQDKQKGQSEGKIQSGSSPSRTITQSPRGCEYETLIQSGHEGIFCPFNLGFLVTIDLFMLSGIFVHGT